MDSTEPHRGSSRRSPNNGCIHLESSAGGWRVRAWGFVAFLSAKFVGCFVSFFNSWLSLRVGQLLLNLLFISPRRNGLFEFPMSTGDLCMVKMFYILGLLCWSLNLSCLLVKGIPRMFRMFVVMFCVVCRFKLGVRSCRHQIIVEWFYSSVSDLRLQMFCQFSQAYGPQGIMGAAWWPSKCISRC